MKRRDVLRGLGAAVALPWMPSLAWASDPAYGLRQSHEPPRRWISMIFGNGVNTEHWWAKGQGAGMELGKTLQSLAPHREDLLVLDNLYACDGIHGAHGPAHSAVLTGRAAKKGSLPEVGVSIDQVLARTIGQTTPLPVLNLGIVPIMFGVAGGTPRAYAYTVSWSSATTPVAPEVSPRAAFDRLFDVKGLKRNQSVLDAIGDLSKGLRKQVSPRDRDKLDEYLQSVRDIENRIDRAVQAKRVDDWQPSLIEPDMDRPPESGWDVPEHMAIMEEIMLLALRMDKTRVATLLYTNDGNTPVSYGHIGIKGGMHGISHHGHKADKLEQYQQINQYHVERFSGVLDKMKAIDEGGSNLLDNSLVLFGSSMMDGDKHDKGELPLILAGRGGGTVQPGRVLSWDDKSDTDRRIAGLHLACAQRLGADLTSFADIDTPIDLL